MTVSRGDAETADIKHGNRDRTKLWTRSRGSGGFDMDSLLAAARSTRSFCDDMTELFKLDRRPLWGDYGDVLLQGQYDQERFQYCGFSPVASIVYPQNDLIVNERAVEIMAKACPNCRYLPCNDVTLFEFDWREHCDALEPPYYPPGGEPENYFRSGLDIADSIPMWQVTLDDFVRLERPSMEHILKSIQDSCSVPEPEIEAGTALPDAPIFAGRYDKDGPNIVYYLRTEAVHAFGSLLSDAVVVSDIRFANRTKR